MKKIIPILMFVLLISSVTAFNLKDIFSKEGIDGNNICEQGENVFLDKDCKITSEMFFCEDECILNAAWFWRILLLSSVLLGYIYRKKIDFRLILVALGILFFLSQQTTVFVEEEIIPKENVTFTPEGLANTILNLPSTISPSHPFIGFLILIAVLMILIKGWDWVDDKIDTFIWRKKR